MKTKRYDEIVSGDIGRFADRGHYWIACGPFEPDGYVDKDGRAWGVLPIVSNDRLKKDRIGVLQGCADTRTRVFDLEALDERGY